MPRLPPWLFRQAKRQSPNLAALLPACRDVSSARNELRWIEQHVQESTRRAGQTSLVQKLCRSRGRGVPLQYVLGSQPFGHLDIKCRPGVLIPRPETEAYTCHLVDLIKKGLIPGLGPGRGEREIGVFDFCTGTGCIPLLVFASLQAWATRLRVLGVDIAETAVRLANDNICHNEELGNLRRSDQQSLRISRADVLDDADIEALAGSRWDVLISNPPYVSQRVWDYGHGQLGYSVRKYEPKLALVPGQSIAVPDGWERQDVFYARLLDVAAILQPKVMLLELGDEAQARRVLSRLATHAIAKDAVIEVWRDWPDVVDDAESQTLKILLESGQSWTVPVKGAGQIRCIFIQGMI
ncbi:Modification methylase HemK [Purpureocillium lavendulum]|uniref:Modification methylase HemK n=1 Tax=Purpureocillium lavendulum TaxID=1247861 RepID=A0AB34FHL5_9HYPO|nr:Modification methylase HemK [Purpureocillium lavendulum]